MPMRVLLQELYSSIAIAPGAWASSLLYCVGQLAIELDEDKLASYLEDLLDKFDNYSRAPFSLDATEKEVQSQLPLFHTTLEALLFCLNNTAHDYHSLSQKIIIRIVPLLFPLSPSLRPE